MTQTIEGNGGNLLPIQGGRIEAVTENGKRLTPGADFAMVRNAKESLLFRVGEKVWPKGENIIVETE